MSLTGPLIGLWGLHSEVQIEYARSIPERHQSKDRGVVLKSVHDGTNETTSLGIRRQRIQHSVRHTLRPSLRTLCRAAWGLL